MGWLGWLAWLVLMGWLAWLGWLVGLARAIGFDYTLGRPGASVGPLGSLARELKSDDSFTDGSVSVETGGAVKVQKVTTVSHLRPKIVPGTPRREARPCM